MEEMVKIGSVFEYDFKFNQKDVDLFAIASGDMNPIHLDEEYAEQSFFGKRILHGFLGGSVFSKYFGTNFPGAGTIYLSQSLTFFKPMFTGIDYRAEFEIREIDRERSRARIETRITNPEGAIVINGEALIQHPVFWG